VNMHYKWSKNALDHVPLPLSYLFEEKEMSRPAPEQHDVLGKIEESAINIVAPPKVSEKPVAAEQKPGSATSADVLGPKIKEALQTDYDAEESIAAIRAILVGPTRRLHDARIEEIVSILEETDRTNQNSFAALENRCEALSARLDAEIKKANDLQLRYLAEFSFALDKKFDMTQSELSGQLAEHVSQSQAAISHLSHQFTVQFKDHDRKIAGSFESLTNKFEERFLKLDEYADQLQQRSADVFVEGLNDIAKRLTALKRNGK
jgi:hypothetical protein